MKFFLELTNRLTTFRLQDDGCYRRLESTAVKKGDKHISSIAELFQLQKVNCGIIIENYKYWINPSSVVELGNEFYLNYEFTLKRTLFPVIPSKQQLASVIEQGDTRISGCIVLNIYGLFEIRNFELIDFRYEDPTIVVKTELFQAENNGLGRKA